MHGARLQRWSQMAQVSRSSGHRTELQQVLGGTDCCLGWCRIAELPVAFSTSASLPPLPQSPHRQAATAGLAAAQPGC